MTSSVKKNGWMLCFLRRFRTIKYCHSLFLLKLLMIFSPDVATVLMCKKSRGTHSFSDGRNVLIGLRHFLLSTTFSYKFCIKLLSFSFYTWFSGKIYLLWKRLPCVEFLQVDMSSTLLLILACLT